MFDPFFALAFLAVTFTVLFAIAFGFIKLLRPRGSGARFSVAVAISALAGYLVSFNATMYFALDWWVEQPASIRLGIGLAGALVAATLAGAIFWPKKSLKFPEPD